jgi:4-amino-4-deoxy-L-arabinose transferase-like glycosyltransferase
MPLPKNIEQMQRLLDVRLIFPAPDNSRSPRACLMGVFLICLLLGLAYAVLNPNSILPYQDAAEYDSLAWSLVTDQGYSLRGMPTALRPPIYPLFLAGVYAIFGHEFIYVRLAQILLHGINALLVYALGRNMFGRRAGLLAGLLYSLYPAFTIYTGLLLSETLTITLMLLALFGLFKVFQDGAWTWAVAGGLAWGLGTLTRPTNLYYPILLFGLFLMWPAMRRLAWRVLVFCLVSWLALAPWVIRNYSIFGRFIPASSMSGWVLLQGTYAPKEATPDMAEFGQYYLADPEQREVEAKKLAFERIFASPGAYLGAIPVKIVYFLLPDGMSLIGSSHTPQGVVLIALQGVTLLLALLGWLQEPFGPHGLVFGSLVCYYITLHALLISTPRYNLPIMPFILILCAAGVLRLAVKGPKPTAQAIETQNGIIATQTHRKE